MANRFTSALDKTKTAVKSTQVKMMGSIKSVGAKTKEYAKNFVTASYGDGKALPSYGARGMIGGAVLTTAFVGVSALAVGLTVAVTPFIAPVALGVVAFTTCFTAGYKIAMAKKAVAGVKGLSNKISAKAKEKFTKISKAVTAQIAKVKSIQVSLPKVKNPFKKSEPAIHAGKPEVIETVSEDVAKPLDTSKSNKEGFDQAADKDTKNVAPKTPTQPKPKLTPTPKK